jgi:hypothetical protein
MLPFSIEEIVRVCYSAPTKNYLSVGTAFLPSVDLNERMPKMNTISTKRSSTIFGMDSTTFHHFIAKTCIFLFFFVSNSKLAQLLIIDYAVKTNQIQREFHSNVAIRTFGLFPASSHLRQTTNFPKLSSASPLLCFSALGFAFSEMLLAEMLRRYLQTESKGNFCLITEYSHKNFLQPQNTRARKQTFSNRGLL